MRAIVERFLQPDDRYQLGKNFQMATAAGAILKVYDDGTVVLRRQFFVRLQQLCPQLNSRLASLLLFRPDFLFESLRSLFHGMSLLLQVIVRHSYPLFLQQLCLTLLLGMFHELQQLILHRTDMTVTSINLSEHGAVFPIGFHLPKLLLNLGERVLGALQIHFQVVLLALVAVDLGLYRL